MIAHMVFFQPKQGTSVAERRSFVDALRSVAREIAVIRRVRVGNTLSIGQMPIDILGQKTFDYAAILEFDDQAGLKEYLDHPVHDKLRGLFWTLCDATLIADVDMADPLSEDADKLV